MFLCGSTFFVVPFGVGPITTTSAWAGVGRVGAMGADSDSDDDEKVKAREAVHLKSLQKDLRKIIAMYTKCENTLSELG